MAPAKAKGTVSEKQRLYDKKYRQRKLESDPEGYKVKRGEISRKSREKMKNTMTDRDRRQKTVSLEIGCDAIVKDRVKATLLH